MQHDIKRTSLNSFLHPALKNALQKFYPAWVRQIIFQSGSKLMPNQRHPLICCFIERFSASRKQTGIALVLTQQKLLSQPSDILPQKLLPSSQNGSFIEFYMPHIQKQYSSTNRTTSSGSPLYALQTQITVTIIQYRSRGALQLDTCCIQKRPQSLQESSGKYNLQLCTSGP